MNFSKFFFFVSLLMIFYVYLGYPLLAAGIAIFRNKRVRKNRFEPTVSILISAYNEEKDIGATLQNKLDLDYPREKLEIIVVSDGSTDRTDEIVKSFEAEGVRLIRQEPRAGKTSALNKAAREANGEILVFSDANSQYELNALAMLTMNFDDPTIGYVTGKMIYQRQEGSSVAEGCTAYMKYENFLREKETLMGNVVGVDGGIDAIKKSLYKPMNPDQLPDFVLPLKVVEQGYRVVYEPNAILREKALIRSNDEYKMRVRVSLRSLWALKDMQQLLSFGRQKLFAWQLWSHKVLRYLCFVFLLMAYAANLLLWAEDGFYKVAFVIQNAFLFGGCLFPIISQPRSLKSILQLSNYFMLLNFASAHAFVKFLLGQKLVLWTPRKGE